MKGFTRSLLQGKRVRLAAGALLAGTMTAGVIGSETLASATPVSGAVTVNGVIPVNAKSGPFVITGAINDAGISPTNNGNNNKSKLILSKGTIKINVANASPAFNFDPTTCAVGGSAPGTVTILGGTRAYKGITGSFNVTLVTHVVGAKVHGACSQNGKPLGGFFDVSGTGTVNIP